ncbi:Alcohol dehydrogenase, class IV [Eubacterium oxidoreducens]|uniref:Alcohol dehydrogenase, class IV n=2 Tax=Eubacterium oxidoreducens TaxID=1732 RepID=A0A1G6CL40_EUBOX|nr:iron-containing alcohol dehydrogenase [Eubacterium oxidoreducens]SDB33590.1 Alcohol dehydrogenase, class IV [Eubacterium oxidoreducens]
MSHFFIPNHVFTGEDALQQALPYMKQLGEKALIVTGPHVGKSPMVEKLREGLEEINIAYKQFDEISTEPDDTMIQKGVAIYQKEKAQFVIGIGGGSPLDAAKAIAAMSVLGGEIADYMGKEIEGEIPGIVAIPTTAGTGSEATRFTVITDSKKDVKMLLKGDKLIPDIAVLCGENTHDMSRKVTAMTGMDALTHAVEAYTSRCASPLTDVYAKSAVKRIMKYLPIAYQNGYNAKAREQMTLAAYEAGVCINNSSVTLVHGMSRPIGALFHVPHGMSNAMLLDACLNWAMDGATMRFARLGEEIGLKEESDEKLAQAFLAQIKELVLLLQIPTPKEYGIKQEDWEAVIDKMATDAIASGSPANTRKEITKEDCIKIYQSLYDL